MRMPGQGHRQRSHRGRRPRQFATEPPLPIIPAGRQQIVVTPRIGGVTREANVRVGVDAVEGILAVIQGRDPGRERIVNYRALAKAST